MLWSGKLIYGAAKVMEEQRKTKNQQRKTIFALTFAIF
jgi:hypothetical protein